MGVQLQIVALTIQRVKAPWPEIQISSEVYPDFP